MFEEIEERAIRNIDRVKNLTSLYDSSKTPGQGRKSVQDTDVLRAAVVMLHASLEDVIRSFTKELLPNADQVVLNNVPLKGTDKASRAEKFFLGALVNHKGKTVDQLIKESVDDYLNQISFNDTTEIITRLKNISINYSDEGINILPSINLMIKRRHNIVHQADANANHKRGSYHATSINKEMLDKWIKDTNTFIIKVLELSRIRH